MKIEMFLDDRKIRKSKIEEAVEYKDKIDVFYIRPKDASTIEIDFGFGEIIISKEIFDRALAEYEKALIEITAEYHFQKLVKLLEHDEKAKTALAVLKKKITEVEERMNAKGRLMR